MKTKELKDMTLQEIQDLGELYSKEFGELLETFFNDRPLLKKIVVRHKNHPFSPAIIFHPGDKISAECTFGQYDFLIVPNY